jgi:hypothetical protein
MKKSFSIQEDNNLTVRLSPGKPVVITIGLTVIAGFYVFIASMLFAIPDWSRISSPDFGFVLGGTALLLYSMLYFLVARAFIRRLTRQEIIKVNATSLIITDKYMFGESSKSYDLQHVSRIFFAGTENFTKHPLDGNHADIGFRGMEGMVQYQITDGNIMVLYGKRQIRFGRNIPSWDAEEIIDAISKYTGKDFTPRIEAETNTPSSKYRGEM